jgi:hypothetical protein
MVFVQSQGYARARRLNIVTLHYLHKRLLTGLSNRLFILLLVGARNECELVQFALWHDPIINLLIREVR